MDLKNFNPLEDIEGMDEAQTSLLFATGFSNIHELSEADAVHLWGRLDHQNASLKLLKELPELDTVKDWIAQAKAIDPLSVAHTALQERFFAFGETAPATSPALIRACVSQLPVFLLPVNTPFPAH